MRHALALAALCLLAACGSTSPADPEDDSPVAAEAGSGAGVPTETPGCDLRELPLPRTRLLVTADVDGDGRDDAVRQATPDDVCPGELIVDLAAGPLAAGALEGPPASGAFVAELASGTRLLVTRQDHPRGGFQSRLYVESGGGLVELTGGEGGALVPFVATDTVPGTPVSVSCSDDGVTVTEARADPANPARLEISSTSYRITDGEAVAQQTSAPGETVPTARLREEYPDLAANAVLEDCRAS